MAILQQQAPDLISPAYITSHYKVHGEVRARDIRLVFVLLLNDLGECLTKTVPIQRFSLPPQLWSPAIFDHADRARLNCNALRAGWPCFQKEEEGKSFLASPGPWAQTDRGAYPRWGKTAQWFTTSHVPDCLCVFEVTFFSLLCLRIYTMPMMHTHKPSSARLHQYTEDQVGPFSRSRRRIYPRSRFYWIVKLDDAQVEP
ncbi:hypothetical protein V8F06_006343 [Rhypophila decipiens]